MKLLATIISLCIFIALFLISTSKTVQGSQNLTSSISRVMSKKRKDPHESLNLSVDEIFFGDIGKIYREAQGYNSTFNCISQDNKNSSSKLSIVQNSHDKNNSKTTDESQDLISTFNNTSSIQSLSVQNVNNKNMSKGILKAQEMTSKLNLILLNRELDSCKNDKIQNISNTILNKLNKNMDSLFDERYYKASDVYMSSNVRRDYIYFEEMYDRIPFLHGLEIIYKGSIKIWEKNKSNLEEKIILALTKFDSKKKSIREQILKKLHVKKGKDFNLYKKIVSEKFNVNSEEENKLNDKKNKDEEIKSITKKESDILTVAEDEEILSIGRDKLQIVYNNVMNIIHDALREYKNSLLNYVVKGSVCLRKTIDESIFFKNHSDERKKAKNFVTDTKIAVKKELREIIKECKKDLIDNLLK